MTPVRWRRVQDVNVNGDFNVLRSLLPSMIGKGRPGHVVMLSSVGGITIGKTQPAYLVSKFGVRVMAQCLREEIADTGAPIGVTTVLPGQGDDQQFRRCRF